MPHGRRHRMLTHTLHRFHTSFLVCSMLVRSLVSRCSSAASSFVCISSSPSASAYTWSIASFRRGSASVRISLTVHQSRLNNPMINACVPLMACECDLSPMSRTRFLVFCWYVIPHAGKLLFEQHLKQYLKPLPLLQRRVNLDIQSAQRRIKRSLSARRHLYSKLNNTNES